MTTATDDPFDAKPNPVWADWKASFGSRPGQDVWHATVNLPDDGTWYARWDPAIDRGVLVRVPWNDASPVRDLGWWPDQQAFTEALHAWIGQGIPLGPDPTLPTPKLIDGPASAIHALPGGLEPMTTPRGKPRAEPPRSGPTDFTVLPVSEPTNWKLEQIEEVTTVDAFFAERPSRGVGNMDYGYFWEDPTNTIPGTWRLTWSDAASEAWIVHLPDQPDSPVIPLGHWPSHPEFLAAIPDWSAHANFEGLDWLLRSTGSAEILDRRPEGQTIPTTDPVPSWAPPGSTGHIDAKLMRKVLAGAIASSGENLDRLCDSVGIDPEWATRVLKGQVTTVPATIAVGLATRIDGFPEDLYGADVATQIAWVAGDQPSIAQILDAPGPALGPEL